MHPAILIIVYCVFVMAASLFGGWLPTVLRLTHTRLQMMMSFVAGVMLGVSLLHLLPHSIEETNSSDLSVGCASAGLLAMFFLIRVFHLHQHAPLEETDHDHHHEHGEEVEHCGTHQSNLSWVGLLLGLSLHTMIDGMALAASVATESNNAEGFGLWGITTFVAVLLHKPFDALSISSVMASSDTPPHMVRWANLAFALMCPVGAALCYFGLERLGTGNVVLGCGLGIAAGVFLCIALADILPEVRFHSHDRFYLSTALLAGVALAVAVGFIEPSHKHTPKPPQKSLPASSAPSSSGDFQPPTPRPLLDQPLAELARVWTNWRPIQSLATSGDFGYGEWQLASDPS